MHSYEPKVGCVGQTVSRAISESCQGLLDIMPADTTLIRFGNVVGSTVRTPFYRISCERFHYPRPLLTYRFVN